MKKNYAITLLSLLFLSRPKFLQTSVLILGLNILSDANAVDHCSPYLGPTGADPSTTCPTVCGAYGGWNGNWSCAEAIVEAAGCHVELDQCVCGCNGAKTQEVPHSGQSKIRQK